MAADSEIIKQCQNGDLEKFSPLYDKYAGKIYDFIYYKTQHKETAEDLLSTTFIKALENLANFKIDGSLKAWLYAIARNTVIDYYRTRKKNLNIEDAWDISSPNDIEQDVDTALKLEEVKQHLSKLKQEQRDIVILRVWQGLSYREIAEIMGKSEPSVKMQFSRTVSALRSELKPLLSIIMLLNMLN